MKANTTKQILKGTTAQAVADAIVLGASETDTVVSNDVSVSYLDALNGVVDVHVSAVTASSGAITATLQDSMDGTTWFDVKDSAAISATGTTTIRWNSQNTTDQDYLPLRPRLRVVVSTGAGDAVTIDSVRIATRG